MDSNKKLHKGIFFISLLFATILFHSIEFRVAAWNIDELIFATGGQSILAGDSLYRDFGDNKPPLIYYTCALIYNLSGKSYEGYLYLSKAITIAVIFLTALGLYFVGNSLGGPAIGMISGLLFAAYSICSQGSEVLGGRTEMYATLMSVISLYFFVKRDLSPKTIDIILCSIFQSLATLYNTRFGIIMAVYGLFILYKHGIKKESVKMVLALSVPFVLLAAAVPTYYYFSGVYDYYTFWQSTIVKHYLGVLRLNMKFISALMILLFFAGLMPMVFFAVCQVIVQWRGIRSERATPEEPASGENKAPFLSRIASKAGRITRMFQWNQNSEVFIFLMMMLLMEYLAFFTGGKPGLRYFYMMYIPLCLLTAQGFHALYRHVESFTVSKELAAMVKVLMVLFLATSPFYFMAIHMNTQRPTIHESIKQYKGVVEYIQKNTSDRDKIYVWVNVTPIYIYSGRTMATSMVYPAEFLCRYYYYSRISRKDITAWDIFLKQLMNEKPALIVDDTDGFNTKKDAMLSHIFRDNYIEMRAAEMRSYIKDHYRLAETIDGFDIYKRI
ncbi:MAG: hypothetical protein KA369_06490 [Spirochaetes bacterium]|nr:hypothetical protein [Spirochaetota bacterium]